MKMKNPVGNTKLGRMSFVKIKNNFVESLKDAECNLIHNGLEEEWADKFLKVKKRECSGYGVMVLLFGNINEFLNHCRVIYF